MFNWICSSDCGFERAAAAAKYCPVCGADLVPTCTLCGGLVDLRTGVCPNGHTPGPGAGGDKSGQPGNENGGTPRGVIVVGDRFESFGRNPEVLLVSKHAEGLGTAGSLPKIPGQGLSEEEEVALFATPAKCTQEEVHKHHRKNVLVGNLRRVGSQAFDLDVRLDDESADMSDHLTGQHIPGMVLIEVARQCLLAVSSVFCPGKSERKYLAVLNLVEARFLAFAFPVPTIAHFTVRTSDAATVTRMSFQSSVVIAQAQTAVAAFRLSYTLFDEQMILEKEALRARRAIADALKPTEASPHSSAS